MTRNLATIELFYFLNAKGRTAALAAGFNAGKVQRILVSPSPPPVPLEPSLAEALQGVATAIQGASEDESLGASVDALKEAVDALTATLNPSRVGNTTREIVDAETWAELAEAALSGKSGRAVLPVGTRVDMHFEPLDTYKARVTGYKIFDEEAWKKERRGNSYATFYGPSLREIEGAAHEFDRVQSAAALLHWQKAEAARLQAESEGLREECAALKAEWLAKKARAQIARYIQKCDQVLNITVSYPRLKGIVTPEEALALPECGVLRKQRELLLTLTNPAEVPEVWLDLVRPDPSRKASLAIEKLVEQKKAAFAQDWIREHGSEGLRLLLSRGYLDPGHAAFKVNMGTYKDERLQVEHPGWSYGSFMGSPVNAPTARQLAFLDRASLGFPEGAALRIQTKGAFGEEILTTRYQIPGFDETGIYITLPPLPVEDEEGSAPSVEEEIARWAEANS